MEVVTCLADTPFSYSSQLMQPILQRMMETADMPYEVNPSSVGF